MRPLCSWHLRAAARSPVQKAHTADTTAIFGNRSASCNLTPLRFVFDQLCSCTAWRAARLSHKTFARECSGFHLPFIFIRRKARYRKSRPAAGMKTAHKRVAGSGVRIFGGTPSTLSQGSHPNAFCHVCRSRRVPCLIRMPRHVLSRFGAPVCFPYGMAFFPLETVPFEPEVQIAEI